MEIQRTLRRSVCLWISILPFLASLLFPPIVVGDDLTASELALIKSVEANRIKAINRVIGSVIAIYDDDRQGGGSGVIIDPSGIALTNHHVIMGAGIEGWGGLADGKMYKWKLIGTDPGGDLAIIQMEGKDDFPFTPLADSDKVRVGDWAMAMGNPFILTEDQAPTVTLGIVSGVKRYQYGAGLNQLVYGNCIQVDSSINPGNSGGPLFSLHGEVIGINGRGSFKERGRVNVGLGYAISANQIKNFIPDLLATKLVEHAKLDASFSERQGKVVCSKIDLDSPVAQAGLALEDELLEFEGTLIKNANQFTNLICTLPEDWPTKLRIRKKPDEQGEQVEKTITVRAYGLPYRKPKQPPKGPRGDGDKTPDEIKKAKRQRQMVELLSSPSGEIRLKQINQKYAQQIVQNWQNNDAPPSLSSGIIKLTDRIDRKDSKVGSQVVWLGTDGRFRIEMKLAGESVTYVFDGEQFYAFSDDKPVELSVVEAKINMSIIQAISMTAALQEKPFASFGELQLDGSDKAVEQNAYRIKLVDDDQDPFFVWVGMYGDDGYPSPRLLKVSANKDCAEDGGVSFHDWKPVNSILLPHRRQFVNGLNEQLIMSIVTEKAEWIESDDGFFNVGLDEKSELETTNTDSASPPAAAGVGVIR